jgi:hypothetical protein
MDLERFQEFMLQSAARHDAEMAIIRESIGSITKTVGRLVDNQVYLQESMDLLTRKLIEEADTRERQNEVWERQNAERDRQLAERERQNAERDRQLADRDKQLVEQDRQNAEAHAQFRQELRELERIVFRHTTDPEAHGLN